ncbi:DapH/DapD/GlmU-related protein [Kaistia dalseonensis]|uniref:Phosphonate metabolism protein (Transferase hexapeptide repeat family) n=1 Tax=Kaistia dalseonensis TaxID=410840 RepID=A0ABU0H8F4_9HYPH|nr:DapH/DapD/GlmU-related protein [Kaistia dalseonensis]MCX5495984.1 DapH/DapD/GlmU-related protein [Kaistia dalseonensis]MDQ0438587.1 phosphonate metabolism protein (transferase hexapeptide repeat family) [Kaistia dalseonensis]
MRLSLTPTVDPTAKITRSALGRYTQVGARTSLTETEMGDYSYISENGDVIYSTIGKFCSIAASVRINPGNHPHWRASQSHFTYRASYYFDGEADEDSFFEWRRDHHVTIGHDVWIGHGVTVLAGISIGTGAIIGAGAVVSKDVGPYEIAVGVAAKPVKRRFPEPIAERLLALGWWDWDHERLRLALPDFRALPIEAFLEKHGG